MSYFDTKQKLIEQFSGDKNQKPSGGAEMRRAGFWRRFFAVLIDSIVLLIPLQIIAAVLFSFSSGFIQMESGVVSTSCSRVNEIPSNLIPAPPANFNAALYCRVFFFGADVARSLTVSQVTKVGQVTKSISQKYMLNTEDGAINGYTLDWIFQLAMLAYLVTIVSVRSATIGHSVLKLRVVDLENISSRTVPYRKAMKRYLAMLIPWVPLLMIVIFYLVLFWGDTSAIRESNIFYPLVLAGLFALCWNLYILKDIVAKVDPIYDRLAGTALLVVPRRAHTVSPAEDVPSA